MFNSKNDCMFTLYFLFRQDCDANALAKSMARRLDEFRNSLVLEAHAARFDLTIVLEDYKHLFDAQTLIARRNNWTSSYARGRDRDVALDG